MDDTEYIYDTANQPKKGLLEMLKRYGLILPIIFFIFYAILQFLFTSAFFSHIMIVNIPQISPDSFSYRGLSYLGVSYQYPQGPTQQLITQLEPNLVSTGFTAVMIVSILIWSFITVAAFVLLNLLGKSPGWSLVSAVGCSVIALIPFLIINIVLMSMMPVYTIDYSTIYSHPAASLLDGFVNDVHMQLVEPIMIMGWVCFGILCIFNIKASENLDLRQALIAAGIPVFLFLVIQIRQYIMEFLHYFI